MPDNAKTEKTKAKTSELIPLFREIQGKEFTPFHEFGGLPGKITFYEINEDIVKITVCDSDDNQFIYDVDRSVISVQAFLNKFKQENSMTKTTSNSMETNEMDLTKTEVVNPENLESFLFQTIKDIKLGKIKPEIAQQIFSGAQVLVNLKKIELQYRSNAIKIKNAKQ